MTSISEVMETMFYMPVEFKENATLAQSEFLKLGPMITCELKFNGDFSGCLTLITPKDLLVEMTQNFMGEPKDHLENEHLLGTLAESLNMIGGNALRKIDSKIPFSLDMPKVLEQTGIFESEKFTIIETTQSMMALHVSVK